MELITSLLSNNFWGIVLVAYLIIATVGVYYRMKDINHRAHRQ